MIIIQEMYNKNMLYRTGNAKKKKILQVQKSYLHVCVTKSGFLLDILYAISDRHRVLFSKFDVIKDFIAEYKVVITFSEKSYLHVCVTKSGFLLDILYAISDRHRVLFSKFDVIKDFIAKYKVVITFFRKE